MSKEPEKPTGGSDYVGPCTLDCPLKCQLPAGAKLSVFPRPRHNWPGFIHCPNTADGCTLSFHVDKSP